MNTKDVIGQKIKSVRQERAYDEEYGTRWYVYSFTLSNGAVIHFQGVETMDTPEVLAHVDKPAKKPRQKQEEKQTDADA